jgi:hypothetical protein
MGERREHLKRPIWAAVFSAAALLIFASLTDPEDNISYSLVVFGIVLVFFISLGHLAAYLRWGMVTPRGRARILIVSALLTVALMLKSAGSLNPVEGLVLLLIGVGMWFYSGRRA